ncbi:MAG: hypothetical protein J6K32_08215 [Clostridia bacterium]|nr:hypothetical protein [Clostridia bacterium]
MAAEILITIVFGVPIAALSIAGCRELRRMQREDEERQEAEREARTPGGAEYARRMMLRRMTTARMRTGVSR